MQVRAVTVLAQTSCPFLRMISSRVSLSAFSSMNLGIFSCEEQTCHRMRQMYGILNHITRNPDHDSLVTLANVKINFVDVWLWLLLWLVVGCWLLVVGCWLLVVGCWLLVVGCWLLVVGCWLLVVGCWLLVSGCWLWWLWLLLLFWLLLW